VGVAALLIATKYEEIYPPPVSEFITLTDNVFNRKQILQMEFQILYNLDFEIQQTSPFRFLERYSKIADLNEETFFLAQYLIELQLLDSKMNQYPPSLLSSAAIYLALRVMNYDKQLKKGVQQDPYISIWTPQLQQQTGYTSSDLNGCAQNYFKLASLIQRSTLQQVMRKFSSPKYKEVSKIMNNMIKRQNQSTHN
jgi:transcription initiation factor TFIIIB Brf1 subunit/transcription initiation factor TFIIB